MAAFYGFPSPSADYAAVTRPAGRGIGILAQGSFLATHANSEASSPTQRGMVPFLRLLRRTRLHVPDNVPEIGKPPGQKTTRQRYEEVHAKPGSVCASCHMQFDPIGFGFEHFDEAGLGAQSVPELQSGAIGIAEAFARLAAAPHFAQRKAN